MREELHVSGTDAGVVTGSGPIPLTANCARLLSIASHVCFGVSPFNSYFSTARLISLARWGRRHFARMHFFVPDTAAAYTLEAMGYTPDRATWKARRQGQYLRNKICRALTEVGVDDPSPYLLTCDVLDGNTAYRDLHARVNEVWEGDDAFQTACLNASDWVLSGRCVGGRTTPDLLCAVRYFLAELPLFLNTPSIVDTDSSVFCYHMDVPFLRRLFDGELACRPDVRQGFIILDADRS
jgi:cyclo(L-tyrosyl-L-tyrosyl) synthase